MTNSLIYLSSGKGKKFVYKSYDCCEYLGDGCNQSLQPGIMYIAIPKRELHDFFLIDANIVAYCTFLSDLFDVIYRPVSTEEAVDQVELKDNNHNDFVFIHTNTHKHSNKHFNASYNLLRYLWYYDHKYDNVAIIATNLYRLGIFKDEIDVLAIACSYQVDAGRSLLPQDTYNLPGLLYFRDRKVIKVELKKNNTFNNVFFKYPIYFNPEIYVKSTFFEDVETKIESKRYILGLQGVLDAVKDVPSSVINNLMSIASDYLKTKEKYNQIYETVMDIDPGFTMARQTPIYLSTKLIEQKDIILQGCDAVGNSKTIKITNPVLV